MLTSYESLWPSIMPETPGAPEALILRVMKDLVIEMCRETEMFKEELAAMDIVANRATYNLVPSWDATIQALDWVKVSGQKLPEEQYELTQDMILTFRTNWIPATAKTAGLLVKVTLLPNYDHEQIDPVLLNRYHEGIVAGTKGRLMIMPKKKWSDPQLGMLYMQKFDEVKAQAIRHKFTGQKNQGQLRVRPQYWA
jgi:hypothetical protein